MHMLHSAYQTNCMLTGPCFIVKLQSVLSNFWCEKGIIFGKEFIKRIDILVCYLIKNYLILMKNIMILPLMEINVPSR